MKAARFIFPVCLLIATVCGSSLRAGEAEETSLLMSPRSPDETVALEVASTPRGCEVSLKDSAKGQVLLTFPIDGLIAGQTGNGLTAIWKRDSSMVALNARSGRSSTQCFVLCRLGGGWKIAAFPTEQMAELAEKNTIPGEKAQSYLDASSWLSNGHLKMTYQGNAGVVNELEFSVVRGANPQLQLIRATVLTD